LQYFHLLLGKQEANNNMGQLKSLEEPVTARSGQFILLVFAMSFASAPTSVDVTTLKFITLEYTNSKKS